MAIIAGHVFIDTPQGRQCEACGRLWTAIASADEEHLGQPGWAHTGNLNAQELKEIQGEVARIWQTVWDVARAPA